MEYPVWDVGVGYGILMALFGVVHVFISHFAIGGGLTLVMGERRARRSGDAAALAHVRRLSAFFAPTTLIVGALSGVGIWFIIGLLNPSATGTLIRTFVWAWAIEWTMFLVEILAAILYARGWDRLSRKAHEMFGWIYFVAAWLSLVVINGIITFMLTPGRWLETGSFWDGFFNPTYGPSLVMRTAICLLMAGLFGGLVATRTPDPKVRARLVRADAALALGGLAVAFASFLWYRAAIPDVLSDAIGARLSIPARALDAFHVLSAALAVELVALLLVPRVARVATALVLLLAGLCWFGSFEWFRESARKPYAIAGVVYGNGLEVVRAKAFDKVGILPSMAARTGDDGRDLFLHECRSCHTLDGYNPALPAFAGTDATYAAGVLGGLHTMRARMPPFAGSAREREALARWLVERADPTPLADRARRDGQDLGDLVYTMRCGRCHVEGGYDDKLSTFVGFSEADVRDALTLSNDAMPEFSGSDAERDALVRHLMERAKKAEKAGAK
jgi:mono/diheme cytochrome c family protein